MEKKAVIYTRVSDPSQIENNSLETQENECKKHALSRGYKVVKVFREEGKSAKFIATRPKLMELLNYCSLKRNKISAVIVYKSDRFSRNVEQGLAAISRLAKYGVEVVSVVEGYENNPLGRALRVIVMAVDQLDNEQKGERVKSNMLAVFRKGLWPFKCPIGYKRKYNSKEENRGLPPIQDSKLAPIIQNVFHKASEGIYSKAQLARMMNVQGFKNHYGNEADHKTVHNILTKSFYYGNMYAKKWDEYSIGKHMPLVDKKTWETAYHKVILKKKRYSYQDDSKYPLKGVLKCEKCDKFMTTSPSRGRNGIVYYYECGNKVCRQVRMEYETANKKLEALMEQFQPTAKVLKLFNHMVFSEWDEIINTAKKDSEEIERKIFHLKEEITSIRKARDDGIYTPEEAKEEAEKMRQEITVLNIEKSDIRLEQYDKEIVKAFTERFLQNTHLLYDRMELPKKQALLSTIFPDGIKCCKNGEIRTEKWSPSFNLILDINSQKGKNVTLLGIEPRLQG
ncbi:recombinase family protein [Patescibacteria group bacterium]